MPPWRAVKVAIPVVLSSPAGGDLPHQGAAKRPAGRAGPWLSAHPKRYTPILVVHEAAPLASLVRSRCFSPDGIGRVATTFLTRPNSSPFFLSVRSFSSRRLRRRSGASAEGQLSEIEPAYPSPPCLCVADGICRHLRKCPRASGCTKSCPGLRPKAVTDIERYGQNVPCRNQHVWGLQQSIIWAAVKS
jgi:hypothetical protein